jgi:tyrosine-specific transport protein
MVLAAIGLVPTVFLLAVTWWIMYRSALVNLELVLQSGKCLDIGSLGKLYGGSAVSFFGEGLLLALMYSLIGAYFYGFASLLCQMFAIGRGFHAVIVVALALSFIYLMTLPIQWLDRVNRAIFIAMLFAGTLLTFRLCGSGSFHWTLALPSDRSAAKWFVAIPVVFTSFGFQVIIAALSDYCAMDAKVLCRAFFWGSLIAALAYCTWIWATLLTIGAHSPSFYGKMVSGSVDVGAFVDELSSIGGGPVKWLVWIISISAIGTSVIGVGMGLCNSIERHLRWDGMPKFIKARGALAILAAAPAATLAVVVPRAFTTVLGFAGVISAMLALFIPIYLLRRCAPADGKVFYLAARRGGTRTMLLLSGIAVVGSELLHFFI